MRNNDVHQILVTKGNQEILDANKSVTDLKPGQIGIFSFETNKSMKGTIDVKNFYLAVGVDSENTGQTTDIRKSAGSHIQSDNLVFYSVRPYQEAIPQILEITGFKDIKCGEVYGLGLELQSENISRTIGDNRFKFSFVEKADCCKNCNTCADADTNSLVKKLFDSVNMNSKGLVKVELIKPDGSVVTDYDAFVRENLAVNTDNDKTNDVILGIRITSIPTKVKNYCGFNKNYLGVRSVFMKVYGTHGFQCSTLKVTTKQAPKIEQGSGYDVKQMEYVAGGWNNNPGPYRMSAGLPEDVNYLTDPTGKYTLVALTYDQHSESGWLRYKSNEATVIAIPKDDTTTLTSLLGSLDKVTTKIPSDPLTDDATGYNVEDSTKDGVAMV